MPDSIALSGIVGGFRGVYAGRSVLGIGRSESPIGKNDHLTLWQRAMYAQENHPRLQTFQNINILDKTKEVHSTFVRADFKEKP